MDGLIEQWHCARKEVARAEKNLEACKQRVEKHMMTHHMEEYENDQYVVKKHIQQRSLMSKKMVPSDIWEKYSLPQRVEYIQLTEKKKK